MSKFMTRRRVLCHDADESRLSIGSHKYQSRLAVSGMQSHVKVDTGSQPLQQSSQSDIDAIQHICHGIDLLYTDHYCFTWPCRPVTRA